MRRPTRNLLYVVLGLVCVALLVQGVGLQIPKVLKVLSLSTPAGPEARIEPSEAAGITTSKESYTPGELVTIAGSGWQPGEVVTVLLQEDPQIHGDATLALTADDSGRILYQFTAEENGRAVQLYVTARGGASTASTFALLALPQAQQVTFIDFAQCANGSAPGNLTGCDQWINGILNPNNSHYGENQSVPQRAEFSVPAGSPTTGRTLTFSFEARKGDIHAYDFITTYNTTQTAAARCQDLGAEEADCLALVLGNNFAVPADPTQVADPLNGNPGLATSGAQALFPASFITMYGGVIDGFVPSPANFNHDAPTCKVQGGTLRYADEHPDQHPDQHPDEHPDQYADEHADGYADQHADQHPDEHPYQYADEH